ncbi:hypothetical protein RB195_001954 [Necator americanus]|uniref:Uncharacterized protein n=1 Tax=Necator americanus TaxID=51031 RepID=A0ABR1DGP5_NECAM
MMVLYVNHTHKRAWCAADEMPDLFVKGEIHEKKVILSVWWGVHGTYRFELLPRSTAPNCKDWLTRSARSTRSSTTFACCTITRVLTSRRRLPRKFWSSDGKFYAPHCPDLAPSDNHLFRSLQHHLEEKRYDDRDHLENDLRSFFASKSPDFHAKGIRDFLRRWQKLFDVDGDYFVE